MARIKALREQLGWSQRRLAERLHCSQATIARMELGQKEPGPVSVLLDQLAEELRTKTQPAGAVA